jgi:hypothetical protein
MSSVQKFFAAILPSSAMKAIESQSRCWRINCPSCGRSLSVWDAGGIRYLATGRKWIFRRCRSCHRTAWQPIEYQPAAKMPDVNAQAGS